MFFKISNFVGFIAAPNSAAVAPEMTSYLIKKRKIGKLAW
jgi:hypothetical protein